MSREMFVSYDDLPAVYKDGHWARFGSYCFWLDANGVLCGVVIGPYPDDSFLVSLGNTLPEIDYDGDTLNFASYKEVEQYFEQNYPDLILITMDFKAVDF
jgi:hypothetical protein